MIIIVLDTNILISEPMILAKKASGITLVVPNAVLTELALASIKRDDISSVNELVREAISKGTIVVHKLEYPADIPFQPLISSTNYPTPVHISGIDFDTLATAKELGAKGHDVRLATQDAKLAMAARFLGLTSIGLQELRQLFLQPSEINANMEMRALGIRSTQARHILIGVFSGVTSSVIANVIWTNVGRIVACIPVWGTFLLIVALGVGLYTVRGRFRLAYGVLECCFGIMAAVRVFWPDFDYSTVAPADIFQMIAGVYILVRGQDNIGKAIQKTRFAPGWTKLFGDQ